MKNRKSNRKHVGEGILLLCVLLFLASALVTGAEQAEPPAKDEPAILSAPPGELAVALKEVPVWELEGERVRSFLLRGQSAYVVKGQGQLSPERYPKLTSDTPLYGEIRFFNDAAGRRSLRFVLDCSDPASDYDLLYFDDNGDADLTNDKPRKPLKESDRLAQRSASLKETYFEPVTVTFAFGPGGRQTVDLLPCLRVYGSGQPQFSFVAARVHTGSFEIDGTSYQAFIGYRDAIQGPLDQPSTTLILAPQGGEPAFWWGGMQLRATHLLGNRYYRFSCTPAGDRLSVRPYDGSLGVFEVGAGRRTVERLAVQGSLRSKESAVAIGDGLERGWPKTTPQCRIPVGDYYPEILDIRMADLHITVSNNYYTNAQGQPRGSREPVAGIAIREDKPYVLDFSNKPAVVFEQPKANTRVQRGGEVKIEAVLVDPVLDIMIRDLRDAVRTKIETYKTADGQERSITRPLSLDPKVTIARTNGEIVAEGIMPFG